MDHKVTFFNLEPWAKEYMGGSAKFKDAGIEVGFEDHILDADHPAADKNFDIAGIFVESAVSAPVIESLPGLKCIVTLSTGFDHIDLRAAAVRGITVSSVPTYGENTVAEYAFGLLLALSRKICESWHRVREEGSFRLDGLRGFDLAGKTIGVVGTGHIGRHVIRMAKGFEMNVLAYDKFPDMAFAAEAGFAYAALPELLAKSDIVTLHVPHLPETEHMMNAEAFGMMKKGAILVNTSRGSVVDTDALIEALKSGQLGGAALDVLEEEGMIKDELHLLGGHPGAEQLKTVLEDHVLIDMPNVIITPHNAFNSKEAFTRILDTTIDNIVNFAKGTPSNAVKI